MALWEAFYIENKRFDLDTLRVPNRSPTPISKSNDRLGQSDDIWGGRGPHFWTILGSSRGPGRPKTHILLSPLKRPPALKNTVLAPPSRSPELIFVDLRSILQAGAIRNGPEPNLGRKPTKQITKLKFRFQFPNISLSQYIRGIPKLFFGQVFFWMPGVPIPKNHIF